MFIESGQTPFEVRGFEQKNHAVNTHKIFYIEKYKRIFYGGALTQDGLPALAFYHDNENPFLIWTYETEAMREADYEKIIKCNE